MRNRQRGRLDPFTVYFFKEPCTLDHWSRLDEFEGPGYRRVVTPIRTADGDLSACIYVIAV
jgi:gamma-glutamylcyclotransferase (GGCT)/AIG2-like uncharacterized protein YtfP